MYGFQYPLQLSSRHSWPGCLLPGHGPLTAARGSGCFKGPSTAHPVPPMPSNAAASRHPLDAAFRPRSVCFVGVSGDPTKTSGTPLRYLLRHGFPGPVYPVNPKYDEIEGLTCYPDVASLPETPDCAFISLPARMVPGAVDALGERGVKAAIILSSGFEETEGGQSHADALRAAANRHGVAIVGPNSEGVWSVGAKAILTFGSAANRDEMPHGRIAVLTQSGGIGGGLSRQLIDGGYGLAYFVSVGNESNTGIPDYIDYLAEQDDVSTILIFMEGLDQGPRLLPACAKARARGIRLIAVKSGNSAAGQAATASHTGKISTPGGVYRDVLDQAGVVQVDSLVDLFDAGRVLTYAPALPDGGAQGGLGILSVLGGPRSIMADRCEEMGVPMATYADATTAALAEIVPAFGYAPNPTDITGHLVGHPEMLQQALDAAAVDPHAEAFILQFGNGGIRDAHDKREMFVEFARKAGKPLVLSLLGDTLPADKVSAYAEDGVIIARDASEAVKYVGWMYEAKRFAARPAAAAPAANTATEKTAAPEGFDATAGFLADAGLPMPPSRLLAAGQDAADACTGLRFPVCLKALPEDAEHKTEKGLLALNLDDADEVTEAADAIRFRLGRADATLLIQEMAGPGVEAVLTVRRDPDFGTLIALGAGGVLVELVRDIGYVAMPAGADDINRRIDSLRLGALLAGFRGAPPADRDALVQAALGLAAAFDGLDGIEEIEINPVLVRPKGEGVLALDFLMR